MSKDPAKIWNIGDEKWNAISEFKTNLWTKVSAFYTLRAYAKINIPDYKIDWFLYPFFYYYLLRSKYYWLRSNHRAFGIRTRLRRLANKKFVAKK